MNQRFAYKSKIREEEKTNNYCEIIPFSVLKILKLNFFMIFKIDVIIQKKWKNQIV